MSRKEMAIYNRLVVVIVNGKFEQAREPMEVRVMARAEGYALVRRKGCIPFAVSEKDLSRSPQGKGTEDSHE